MQKTLSLSEVKMKLNRLVESVEAKDDEIVITKNGSPITVLVSFALYEGWRETKEIEADRELMKEIRRGLKKLKKKAKRYTYESVFGERI